MHKYDKAFSVSPTQIEMKNITRKVAPGNFLAQFTEIKEEL